MQIRALKLEEIELYKTMQRVAFVVEESPRFHEWIDRRIKPNLNHVKVLVGDDGEVKNLLRIIFPRLWLGHDSVAMPGITSVATPPENRRLGYVKHLLTGVMQELRESGYGISTLYPFSFPFYKKFGYEQASTSKEISVKISALDKFKPKYGGSWKPATIEQWQEFNAIYEGFCQGKFGPLTRHEAIVWEPKIKGWMPKTPHLAYLWYNAQGQAQAYVIYTLQQIDERSWEAGREMQIDEMAWLNLEAKHEVLAFLANHDSQAKIATWETSASDEFFGLLDDPREAKEKLSPGYMLRILDVTRALEERPWDNEAKGNFTIALRDDRLEWNNRAVQVEVAGGKAQVRTLPNADKAGLSCDIRQLSQLYAGYLSPLKLAELGLLETHRKEDLMVAQRLFSVAGQPASHMMDHF